MQLTSCKAQVHDCLDIRPSHQHNAKENNQIVANAPHLVPVALLSRIILPGRQILHTSHTARILRVIIDCGPRRHRGLVILITLLGTDIRAG